jgi:RimJ/RimL family protein N-acetyltransferase
MNRRRWRPPEVRFEPFNEAHLDHIPALIADDDVMRFSRIPDPPPEDFPRHWLEMYERGREDGTREGFAAFDGDGRFLGLALVPEIDREGSEAELGYMVAPDARGQGVATEILRWLTEWAFEELDAQRLVLLIDVDNAASERIAERCGYVREGVMRSLHLKQGIRNDASLWSRLPSDPPPDGRRR